MSRNKRGQSTVEYAIVVGVVVAALVAMQTYLKRGLQARYHDGIQFLANETDIKGDTVTFGNTTQYEPYYASSSYITGSEKTESEDSAARGKVTRSLTADNKTRDANGYNAYANTTNAN